MTESIIKAHAKINLSLDVTGKRPDGYHQVKMVMQSISLYDQVIVKRTAQETGIRSNVDTIPLDEGNIALRAWYLMREKFSLPGGVDIFIEKNIPVEAGLAGGSTDAAAVLKAVNSLFDLGLTKGDLTQLGVKLGADVAFCIWEGTALAEGIGEIITPLSPPPTIWMVLVNPGFGVSTASVYHNLDLTKITNHPDTAGLIDAIARGDLFGVRARMNNVLEGVTLERYPIIRELKEELNSLGLAPLMSGSGPTVFAVARDRAEAERAWEAMRNKWKTVLVVHTI